MPSRRGRLWPALLLAPLVAPLAVLVGTLMHGLFNGAHSVNSPNGVVAVLFVGLWLVLFGAPLAYGLTLAVVWPLFHLLQSAERARGWAMAIVGSIAGGVMFPVYLHLLAPRGTFSFFPGAGYVAGAASAASFWLIATRSGQRD
jgi:hypothetical protein